MTQDEATKALADVRKALNEQFQKMPSLRTRLDQFNYALATAEMAAECLYDEAVRHGEAN